MCISVHVDHLQDTDRIMITHKATEPCWCVGMTTLKCACKCHIAKSNVRVLKEQLKKAKKSR